MRVLLATRAGFIELLKVQKLEKVRFHRGYIFYILSCKPTGQ